jgi:hypothetical protein
MENEIESDALSVLVKDKKTTLGFNSRILLMASFLVLQTATHKKSSYSLMCSSVEFK